MSPIPDINPNTDVDIADSCNCWSSCCGSKQQKQEKQEEKNKVLDAKIRRIVMEELAVK